MKDYNMPRTKEVSDKELIDVLRKTDEPVLTASEVADEVSIGRQAVADRLGELSKVDGVCRKKPNRDVFYWVP